jgi:hypothetical protein
MSFLFPYSFDLFDLTVTKLTPGQGFKKRECAKTGWRFAEINILAGSGGGKMPYLVFFATQEVQCGFFC